MKVKVCGLRQAQNITAVGALPIDFVGFIFHPPSPRFVRQKPTIILPKKVKRVGVFVQASLEEIKEKATAFELDYLQLHGGESPAFCQSLAEQGYAIIKVFSIEEHFEWEQLQAFEGICTFFLLDTKGAAYGGNGFSFDWNILKNYPSDTPFLLSGGIGPTSLSALQQLAIPQLYGVDINSQFEEAPALKNVELIQQFIQQLQSL